MQNTVPRHVTELGQGGPANRNEIRAGRVTAVKSRGTASLRELQPVAVREGHRASRGKGTRRWELRMGTGARAGREIQR